MCSTYDTLIHEQFSAMTKLLTLRFLKVSLVTISTTCCISSAVSLDNTALSSASRASCSARASLFAWSASAASLFSCSDCQYDNDMVITTEHNEARWFIIAKIIYSVWTHPYIVASLSTQLRSKHGIIRGTQNLSSFLFLYWKKTTQNIEDFGKMRWSLMPLNTFEIAEIKLF